MRPSTPSCARWLPLALAAACAPVTTPAPRTPAVEPPSLEAARAPAPTAPVILSAQLVRIDDPELDGKDGVMVVLDAEVDAASLDARAFIVVRAQAGPVAPQRALLAPASEDDENRTVLLVGELHDAGTGDGPTHVAVVGPLWAEDGRSLRGLGAPVLPFGTGPRALVAEVLATGPGRCEGAAQRVRTYWSTELRGVEPSDLARVRIVAAGSAAALAPSRFDDHDAEHGEAGQDNVLDLCLDDPAPPRRVTIEAGAFHDPAGHPSVAAELVPTDRKVAPVEPALAEPAR
jgi:hypothetical protein